MTLSQLDLKYIWHPCSQIKDYKVLQPIVIKSDKNVFLYDENGKEYIDIISSWWCNLLGHTNEQIIENIKAQLDTLEHVIFANFTHELAINLAMKLAEILLAGLVKFNFSDNGLAAVECVLKMAFWYHYQTIKLQKTRFMCLIDVYHGETIGALSVGAMDLYYKIYRPMLMDVIRIKALDCYRCEFGKCLETCQAECFIYAKEAFAKFSDETVAVIVEPLLQGGNYSSLLNLRIILMTIIILFMKENT
ncbi:aminotransferase class III-fold pyridoxal phosphate-dependent enzyme [Campylobacter sp. faydin G-24]|uniref:Aminotransferase class III-fold pyridoxal phosphate-dependent enzyme n=1 Tax=Campylobacter anatolicus TaxID=2829105 RepID=A0ABS5HHB8_9BACT|nr:aminotransferase class III-fold pyridoxal phosphate-dependent enzyme [Campylobacter anatolicus]MBR8463528.1 aminotransferase class III-fold pyridoxal phosphate-dependent enzyme [Campylobacter anatolicus]